MHIVMTGVTGFLGSALARSLLNDGHDISALVRQPKKSLQLFSGRVASFRSWHEAPEQVDAVINLAGEPLVGERWTAQKKDRIRSSRLTTTDGLVAWLQRMQLRPEVLLSGSAVGFYGYGEREVFTERSAKGTDFGAGLCADWEQAALAATALGVRVCLLRSGIVLHPSGGALKRMLPAYRMGLGGPIAGGQQGFSWIHLQDWINAVRFLLRSESLSGAFNLTSPHPLSNAAFSAALAAQLKRGNVFRIPAFLLRALFGEGAELLIQGQHVLPARLQEAGFVFSHPELSEALADLLT